MRFVPNWKVALLLAFAFAGTVQGGGCTNREIASGVAGGVIGAIIVDAHRPTYSPPPRQRCVEVERTRCWPVRDYYGRTIGQECRTDYDSCARRYNMSLAGESKLNVGEVAETYKLTNASAEKFVGALTTAQTTQDEATAVTALQSICLNVEELKTMGKSGSLSTATVDCLAQALNQDPTQTAMMVNSITETARAQDAARTQNSNN